MKRLVAIITAIALFAAGINFTPKKVEASVTSSQGSSSWSLVWSDEFNQASGSTVNSNYWQFDIGTGDWGWGNAELQYYTNSTENVRVLDVDGAVDGKALAITAKRSNGSITSGRIKSLDKQYVKYGRVEARIRTSNGMQPGVWPAFWMMGNDINSSGWPNCGEIDIMEHRNTEAQVISSLHWNPNANGAYAHSFYGSELNGQYGFINSMDDWHTYALEWYEDCMKFYLDGNCYETITLTSEMAEEFHKPHYILLNLAIGSTSSEFTKYITVTDSWSESTMYVDYVRLYQGSDSSFYRALSSDTSGIVTTASPTAGMTACDGSGNWISAGSVWDYSIGTSWSGASAYYTGGSQNDFTIYMSSASTQDWGAMIRANHSVTAGHTYNYSINYTSTAAGSLLVKEDVSSTGEQTVGINKGSGTITGSFTAGDSQSTAQLLMDLRGISTGTKLSITGLTLTDMTSSEVVTTTVAPVETTAAPVETTTVSDADTTWTAVDNSNNEYFYGNANNMTVVNVQQPGWSAQSGIYMSTSEGIGYITINGTQIGSESAAIDGAGAVIYLTALTSDISTVSYHRTDGTVLGSISIKKADNSSEVPTTEVPTTEAPTTEVPTTEVPTTTASDDDITISDDIKITGYQMTSTLNGVDGNMGFRVVYQAEPTVEGKTVTEQGLVYGIAYGDNPITENDVVYDSTSAYVKSFVASDEGKLSIVMGDSTTASYYVMTMNCGSENPNVSITTDAYTTPYFVRSYAKLSDGSIVYSSVKKFTIFDVADYVYENVMVNQESTYNYLYSKILHYVDSTYKEGDFDWGSTIIK